jgi:gamma-glutamylcyclotransferase
VNGRALYFAYGSNMAVERLRARVSSARLVGTAVLAGHALRFHKPGSNDGSAKCDAARTGHAADAVLGALYSMDADELALLDRFEGRGNGYERKTVSVVSPAGEAVSAETYIATRADPGLRPLDWYKEHVLRGARALELPAAYIAAIEAVAADVDTDEERRARELAIYASPGASQHRS